MWAELGTSAHRLSARTSFLFPPFFSKPSLRQFFFFLAMVVARMDEKNKSLCYAMRNPPRGVKKTPLAEIRKVCLAVLWIFSHIRKLFAGQCRN